MAQGLYNHSTIPLTKEEEELQELQAANWFAFVMITCDLRKYFAFFILWRKYWIIKWINKQHTERNDNE